MAPPATIKKERSREVQLVREVVSERRKGSIQQREVQRLGALVVRKEKKEQAQAQTRSKYPKSDIQHLKQIFDSYDADGSGSIDRGELMRALQKQKQATQHFDPLRKKTLEDRQAEKGVTRGQAPHKRGVFLVDFSESLFRTMDVNTDGHVEFDELLRTLYPFATNAELQTMLGWVAKEEPVITLDEFRLTDEQRREVHSMFAMYDKDRNGLISRQEFRQAMRRCGLDAEETDELFAEADLNGDEGISLQEFTELMRTTLFDGESVTPAMLYGAI